MQVESKTEDYRNLKEKRIKQIILYLEDLDYPLEVKDYEILPYVAQWLYDNYINKESTCVIISTITNINRIQEKIDEIYDGVSILPAKSHLQKFLEDEEFLGLEKLLEPRKHSGTVTGQIDKNTFIVTNFKKKQVLRKDVTFRKDGEDSKKFTPIIEAVPDKLIVYDSPLLEIHNCGRVNRCNNKRDRKLSCRCGI